MHGSPFCSATSCARRCFLTVSGKYVPPLTVASLATITHSWPSITPIPVTMPADGACPSYMSQAARAPSSRNALPGSSRRSTRSRAGSLPRERWASIALSPAPRATKAVRSRSSATSASICSRRRQNTSDSRSTCDVSTLMGGGYRPAPAVGRWENLTVRPNRVHGPAPRKALSRRSILPAIHKNSTNGRSSPKVSAGDGLRIQVHPDAREELLEFLRRVKCEARADGDGAVFVEVPDAIGERHARLEIDLYLKAWQAEQP